MPRPPGPRPWWRPAVPAVRAWDQSPSIHRRSYRRPAPSPVGGLSAGKDHWTGTVIVESPASGEHWRRPVPSDQLPVARGLAAQAVAACAASGRRQDTGRFEGRRPGNRETLPPERPPRPWHGTVPCLAPFFSTLVRCRPPSSPAIRSGSPRVAKSQNRPRQSSRMSPEPASRPSPDASIETASINVEMGDTHATK